MEMTWLIRRTGKKTYFLDLSIGNPFFAHEKLWVRTSFEAASELLSTEGGNHGGSACDFLIDGVAYKGIRPHSFAGYRCEVVEDVELIAVRAGAEKCPDCGRESRDCWCGPTRKLPTVTPTTDTLK